MRFWYGMRLPVLVRTVLRHHDRSTPLNWPALTTGMALGAVNSCLATLDALVWSGAVARAEPGPAPLFVLGHWRCGTTYLHELLALDPRHTFPTTYQCMTPDHFLLSQGRFRHWLVPDVSGARAIDNVAAGWDRPQEDEFALCNLGLASPYHFTMFPGTYGDAHDALDLESLSADERERWKAQLTRFLKRVGLGAPGRRIVLKSPPHSARIPILHEAFPEARFIHIVRDPVDVVSSMVRLYQTLLPKLRISGIELSEDELCDHVLDIFSHLDAKLEAGRAVLAKGAFAQVRYEELRADPVGVMAGLYRNLSLGDFAPVERALRHHLAETPAYNANHHQRTGAFSTTVRRRMAGYCRRHGYPSAPGKAG